MSTRYQQNEIKHDELDQLNERIKELESILTTFENAPVSFIQLDLKFNLLYANEEGKGLFDKVKSSSIYHTLKEECKEAFAVNLITVKEYVLEDQYYECQFVPVIDKGLINICLIEVTNRKETESKLRKSEYRYRKIIETASDIVYRASPEGYFKYANPIAIRKMKFSMAELKHKRFTDLILDKYVEEAEKFYLKQFKNKIPNTYYEFPVRAKDGEVYWLGQHVQAIIEDGYIHEYLAVARDITEKKKAEQELVIARQKAEESAKAKEQFLANMSHEIRTPLNVIMGMANLLKTVDLEDTHKEYLNAILNSSSNLLVIINDILDLTKVEAGSMLIEHIEFNFNELINAVIASNKLKSNEKSLTLTAEIDPEIAPILIGDPTRLNQVLLNLINNAVKFTPKGSVKLICELIDQKNGENLINFKISDTGIGIAPENIDKIFDSFTQEDASVTRKFGGTGLGLAISKRIVELMEGKLEVESEKNVGTTFSFKLSFQIGTSKTTDKVEQEKNNNYENVKVLVAEDNEFNQMLIKAILKKNKFDYHIVNNGQEVLDAVIETDYDLILMDIQMPVLGGEETVKILKQGQFAAIPVIALTANALIGDREKYLSTGLKGYISKPFTEAELLDTINKVILEK